MLFFILLFATVAFLIYYFRIKRTNYWTERGVKQGQPMWFIGDFKDIILRKKSVPECLQDFYNMFPHSRYSGLYEGPTPVLLIKDPDLLKQVTVKYFEHFMDHRPFVHEEADPLWAKGLFASRGQKWKNLRPILSPSFTSSKMKTMFILMADCAETFAKHFLSKNQDVVEVEMKDIFSRFANDVIATTAFGIKVDSLNEPKNEFYVMGKRATDISRFWLNLSFTINFLFPIIKEIKYLSIRLFQHDVVDFFTGIVNETLQVREEKGIFRPDLLQLLLEAKKGYKNVEEKDEIETGFATAEESQIGTSHDSTLKLTNVDIAAQAIVFFFAAFDTVSTLATFMAYELTVNPDIQSRLRTEIRDTLEKCRGKLTYDDLMKMKYMDMVVSESLRKWPSMIQMDRICTKSFVIEPVSPDEKPVLVEKGVALYLPFYCIHRDPQNYPDPEKFDPERFSDENKRNIKPCTYLPFGAGPRNCIGSRFALLEVKVLFFHVLTHFEIIPIKKTQIPLKMSKKPFGLVVEGGLHLGLQRL